MPISTRISVAHMISAHSIPDGIDVNLVSLIPGRFHIPSCLDNPKEVKKHCTIEATDPNSAGQPASIKVQLAEIRKGPLGPYVYLTIPDCVTRRIGYEEQLSDEWGRRLSPPIQRSLLTVPCAKVVNEIERQHGHYGIMAIEGELPSDKELKKVHDMARQWQIHFVNETSNYVSRYGSRQATELAIFVANELFKNKLIPSLPAWAIVQAQQTIEANEAMGCPNCGALVRPGSAVCVTCRAILDWKRALEFGIVKAEDVPPTKRADAGLQPLPTA